mgnify:CR=1 FL=1
MQTTKEATVFRWRTMMSKEYQLPKLNIEWTKLSPDAVVELKQVGRNTVYVAKLPSGDALVNWEGRHASQAHAFLDNRVAAR